MAKSYYGTQIDGQVHFGLWARQPVGWFPYPVVAGVPKNPKILTLSGGLFIEDPVKIAALEAIETSEQAANDAGQAIKDKYKSDYALLKTRFSSYNGLNQNQKDDLYKDSFKLVFDILKDIIN